MYRRPHQRRSGITLRRQQPRQDQYTRSNTFPSQPIHYAEQHSIAGQEQPDEDDLFEEEIEESAVYELNENEPPSDFVHPYQSASHQPDRDRPDFPYERSYLAYGRDEPVEYRDRQSFRSHPYESAEAHTMDGIQQPPPRWDLSRFSHDRSDPSGEPTQYTPTPRRELSQHHAQVVPRYHEPTRTQSVYELERRPSQIAPEPASQRSSHFRPEYMTANGVGPQQTACRYVQGIEILSTRVLPDRFRVAFPFPNFNAVQSKCFNIVHSTNDNFVLSSPTGSGKTVIFELAICRLISIMSAGQYKVVYQAPTKSLCAERANNWQQKYRLFDIQCAELTGDTDSRDLHKVQNATIIVTTPEKWDSMTRKWKDHEKLMRMVKLFLIDEVHILKEDRGATLEAIVSRMKSVGANVRFIALSATVPNSEDIAEWLGKDSLNSHLPAHRECFGEEFRPVLLEKHVEGYTCNGNDFALDSMLTTKLPSVIAKYSKKKPIMVFCMTRKIAATVAEALTNWWSTKNLSDRHWAPPHRRITVHDAALKLCASAAVAFHHAGLSLDDRVAVERGFLDGNINVICCTSTLAVGVNLPCHLVIIKNTLAWQPSGLQEYSDLEIMQMLGRAGRPQFDRNAIAVIMTRQEKVRKYQMMVSGHDPLESTLHVNLIDHLNAEIALGTVKDLASAKSWLQGTFLYVRMKKNFFHYDIGDDNQSGSIDEKVERILQKDIGLLQDTQLVSDERRLTATPYGHTAARYYVQFETAQTLLGLEPKAKLSEILSGLCQASEFKDLRFRNGEKQVYKDLNKSPNIRFPIPVKLDLPAHKVSLIIQAQLAVVDFANDEKTARHRQQYLTEVAVVFQHVNRLVRCYIDFQLETEDSVALRNALLLARCLGSKCWDDSPLQLRQLHGIGPASIRKLVNHDIKSIDDLENCSSQRIETILGRNPPYGMEVLRDLKSFPKLRVSIQMMGQPSWKAAQGATVHLKATVGFLNDPVPNAYHGKIIYIIFLAETSDGRKICFARNSARRVGSGQDLSFTATLISPLQEIRCYVMCDEFAGTMQSALLKPTVPSAAWPKDAGMPEFRPRENPKQRPPMNISAKRNTSSGKRPLQQGVDESEDFGNDDIDDMDLAGVEAATHDPYKDVDEILDESRPSAREKRRHTVAEDLTEYQEPAKLPNGRWKCNHSCSQRGKCKHACCEQGMDHPPKVKKPKLDDQTSTQGRSITTSKTTGLQHKPKQGQLKKGQTQLSLVKKIDTVRGRPSTANVPEVDMTSREPRGLSHSTQSNTHRSTDRSSTLVRPVRPQGATKSSTGNRHEGAGNTHERDSLYWDPTPTDRENIANGDWIQAEVYYDNHEMKNGAGVAREIAAQGDMDLDADEYNDCDSLLDEAMIGLADSQYLGVENVHSKSGFRHKELRESVQGHTAGNQDRSSAAQLSHRAKATSPKECIDSSTRPGKASGIRREQCADRNTSVRRITNESRESLISDERRSNNDDPNLDQHSSPQNTAAEPVVDQPSIAPWLLAEFGQFVDFV